ncbi:MAG: siderophore-interacting protein [Microthrixaceae bacterium]
MSTPLHGQVIRTERLTPRLIRVVLGGPGLASYEPAAATDQYVQALFAPEGAPYTVPFDVDEARAGDHRPLGRRYTIRAWDPAARELTIDFVVHGDVGVAGRWANRARPGDLLQFLGPSGGWSPDPGADWYLFAGDESALPAIAASLEQVPAGRPVLAVLLVDDADHELPLDSPGDLRATWIHRTSGDDPSGRFLAAVEALQLPEGEVSVFVHGEAAETRAIRKHLLGVRGIERARLSVSPYWRRGQTDEAWRQVKKEWLADVEQDVPTAG